MIQKQAAETNRFLRAIWKSEAGEREALLSRTQSFEAAQETLRDYWRLGETATITFELEIVDSSGTAHRGGITPPAWAEVAEHLEYVLVTVQEEQEPALQQAGRKEVQFTTQASIPGSTLSASSGSTRQTAASEGEGSGGSVLRSSREKHRSIGISSRPNEGGRRHKTRNTAQGTISCQQCIGYGILCELQTRTAFICLNCKTYGLPCSNKPADIGEIEQSLRLQQTSSDTGSLMSSVLDSEMAGSRNGRGFLQDPASEKEVVSDSEGENEFED